MMMQGEKRRFQKNWDECVIYAAINKKTSLSVIEELLQEGHCPDMSPPGCPLPLHRAVFLNRPDIALLLIRVCSKVTMARLMEKFSSPIICLAAGLNMTEVVLNLCMKSDCNVLAIDSHMRTMLHIAVAERNYDLLERLPLYCVDCKPLLTRRDEHGLTPLHVAASVGDLTSLKLLLRMEEFPESEPPVDTESLLPRSDSVQAAELDNSTANLPNLQSQSAIGSKKEMSQLKSCRKNPHFISRQNLLQHTKKTNSVKKLTLAENDAVQTNKTKDSETLLSNIECSNPNPYSDEKQNDNFHVNGIRKTNCDKSFATCENASSSGEFTLPVPLPVQGTSGHKLINLPVLGSKETMLHLASKGHHVEMVEFLIKLGAHVNARNMMNNTPLHFLFMEGPDDRRALTAARLLLNAGADWTLKGTFYHSEPQEARDCVSERFGSHYRHAHEKVTVAMVAAIRDKVAYLKLLTEFGENFESVSGKGRTTLMHALSHSSGKATDFLLADHPESPDLYRLLDARLFSALHHAAMCKTRAVEYTQVLLDRGYGAVMSQDPATCNKLPENTPITCAIMLRRFGVLKTVVAHDPSWLLRDTTVHMYSPLHVTLQHLHGEDCIPYVDFLLAHGCDGNAIVNGWTAYNYAMRGRNRQDKKDCVFSAEYLKKKLGAFFLDTEHCDCQGQKSSVVNSDHQITAPFVWRRCGHELLTLRDMCLHIVRQRVRAAQRHYHEDIRSLPLPSSLIRCLLFKA